MTWHLDHTDADNRRWQFDLDCTLDYNTFASSIKWDEEGTLLYQNDNTSNRIKWLEERGIDEARFIELRNQNCGPNLVLCNDPNTKIINYGNYSDNQTECKSRGCRCMCKDGYTADSSGKCSKKMSSQSSEAEPLISPAQIIGGVGVGVTLIVIFTLMTRKGGDNSE